ncbi:MAG: hypothetical protein ACE5HO_09500 [bacterium]
MRKLFFVIIGISVGLDLGSVMGAHSSSGNETAKGYIVHAPVSSLRENEKLVVEANVAGALQNVIYMRLYYRSEGEQTFNYIEMTRSSTKYFAELDPGEFSPPELQYFILALLTDNSVLTYPNWNPYGNPVVVKIAAGMVPTAQPSNQPDLSGQKSNLEEYLSTDVEDVTSESPILILSPEKGEKISNEEDIVIAASLMASEDSIDSQSINIFVDGLNVTLSADVNENLITFITSDLKPGPHSVLIQGYYASGAELPPAKWSFTVVGETKTVRRSTVLRGRVFAETRQESISKRKYSDNNIGGNLHGQYGVAEYDARLLLTSRESGRSQPRHRYTLNVQLPILGVTFGDTYPRFNDLMLWGKRVRGIYGRLHLGFFNVDVVHGQTVRKISAIRTAVIDPATGLPLMNAVGLDSTLVTTTGTYKQRLFGIRPSFGSGKHFQWGFNFVNVREDTNSLKLSESSRPPQDNLVVGTDMLFAFDNRRFEVRGGVATSFFTKDISNGALSKQQFKDNFDVDLPINPKDFEDFIIINSSTTPLDPRELTALAWNVNVRFNYLNNNLQFGYKSVGSEYISLANSYLRTDLRGFSLQDRLRVYRNKVFVNFGFERYRDNFSRDNGSPSTKLNTFYYGMTLYPGQGLPNFSFNFRNHNRDNDINQFLTTDPVDPRENNTTKDLSAQVNYDVRLLQLDHTVSFSYIKSDRNDHFGRVLSDLASNVELFSIRTQHRIPLVTTFSFARNDNKFGGGANTFNFKMYGLKMEYLLFNRRLRTHLNSNFTSGSGSNLAGTVLTISDYSRVALNLGLRLEITPGQFVTIDGHLIKFSDNGRTVDNTTNLVLSSNPSFTDRILRVYYEKRF